jgi:hypothetical protein
LKSEPSATPVSASIAPSERSKPPAIITNVSPIETTQRMAALVSSASMFPLVKKRSCVSEKKMNRATSSSSTAMKRCADAAVQARRTAERLSA